MLGANGKLSQDGVLWHEDCFELKSNQNSADSGKVPYLPQESLKEFR